MNSRPLVKILSPENLMIMNLAKTFFLTLLYLYILLDRLDSKTWHLDWNLMQKQFWIVTRETFRRLLQGKNVILNLRWRKVTFSVLKESGLLNRYKLSVSLLFSISIFAGYNFIYLRFQAPWNIIWKSIQVSTVFSRSADFRFAALSKI